jgi:hypothetical protein
VRPSARAAQSLVIPLVEADLAWGVEGRRQLFGRELSFTTLAQMSADE